MINNIDGLEKLYLSKGEQNIYIENCRIPQHHIDGIRFLYKQYKKKKSGVIITDTSGYGRKVQTVLFLKAVRHLFDKPVLVLCVEGSEHDWMEQFQMWTDLFEDVVLETQKPFVKKRVLINTMSNLATFCRRDWSVLVVDGDKASHEVLALPFKADFKIWITLVNMKENLDKFSKIYQWLYPKEKFDKTVFMPDKKNPKDVVDKAVLLDAFMEDIVAKSDEPDTSRETHNNVQEDSPPVRISRKNKDATGTKIKRSKRKIYDDDDDDLPLSKTKRDVKEGTQSNDTKSATPNNIFEITLAANDNAEISEDFSIDNFKRKSIEEFNEDLLGDTEPPSQQVDLYYEPDSSTDVNSDRLYEMDTLVFGNDTCNEQSAKEIKKDIEASKKIDERDRKEIPFDPDDNTPSELDFDTSAIKDEICKVLDNELQIDEFEKIENGETPDLSRESLSSVEMKPNNEDNLDLNDEINENCEISRNSGNVCDEIESKINEIDNLKETSLNDATESNINDNDRNNEINEVQNINENEANTETKPVTNETEPPVTNPLKRNTTDEKMKELEEKVLKKFKGSILDSL